MADLDLSVYSEDEVRAMRTALGMALAGVSRDRVVESVTAQGVADPEGFVTAAVEHVWQLLGLEGMTREFHVAARWSLYGSARAAGELKICRELLTDLARLQGLYPGQRAVTTPGGENVQASGGKGAAAGVGQAARGAAPGEGGAGSGGNSDGGTGGAAMSTHEEFEQDLRAAMEAVVGVVVAKNRAYGDSALNPVRCFSRAPADEQMRVRMDDKISRLMRGDGSGNEDAELDLLGYLLLMRVWRLRQARSMPAGLDGVLNTEKKELSAFEYDVRWAELDAD